MGMPGTPLGMLVPPELEPEELLLGLDEPWVDPLCPDGLDDGEEEGEEGDEDEGDDDELLGDEGELLGDGMLGDGMPEDGLLGGGWLLLFDEQPARASAIATNRTGSPRPVPLSVTDWTVTDWTVTDWIRRMIFTLSPPATGAPMLSYTRRGRATAPHRESDPLNLNGACTAHGSASSSVRSTRVTCG